jgi:hypothetical protein
MHEAAGLHQPSDLLHITLYDALRYLPILQQIKSYVIVSCSVFSASLYRVIRMRLSYSF